MVIQGGGHFHRENATNAEVCDLLGGHPRRGVAGFGDGFVSQAVPRAISGFIIDLSVIYPTVGLLVIQVVDDEVRQAAARALNKLKAEMYAGYTDRLLPQLRRSPCIPQEAVEELEYAVRHLGVRENLNT